jgi:hypothetical protein
MNLRVPAIHSLNYFREYKYFATKLKWMCSPTKKRFSLSLPTFLSLCLYIYIIYFHREISLIFWNIYCCCVYLVLNNYRMKPKNTLLNYSDLQILSNSVYL